MTNTSRRDLLVNAGKLVASFAMSSSSLEFLNAMVAPCGVFNIVLHGLFVIDVQDCLLQISTPDCTGLPHKHKYRAGYWQNSYKHFVEIKKNAYSPNWKTSCSLPNYADLPVLINSQMGRPKHKDAYFSLILPYPRGITGLRVFKASEIKYPAGWISATKFPLVTVLSYDNAPVFAPIAATPWDPPTNYHIFAEPDVPMTCTDALAHGNLALGKLWDLFDMRPPSDPLPNDPTNCSKPPDPPPNGLCVDITEENALSELNRPRKSGPKKGARKNLHAAFRGVHMPTCAVFLVPPAS